VIHRIGSLVIVLLSSSLVLAQVKGPENPEYKSWSGCKVGTWVKLKTEMDRNGVTVVAEQTTTLVEIAPKKLTVEQSGTATVKGKMSKLPVQKIDLAPDDPSTRNVIKQGDEELTVNGKKLKCHWEEIESEDASGKVLSKLWNCPEVPGSVVKMEMRTAGAAATSIRIDLLEWEKK
jgi:hypothetical protein